MGHEWLAATTPFSRTSMMARAPFGGAPAPRSSPMFSAWPTLASRPVQWLQSVMKSLNFVVARVQRVSSFVGKNQCYGVRYL
jgi:hypothetical protein